MTATMTGLVHYALQPQAVELRELPVPELGEEDVLLRVGAVSVCGSDVHQYHNKQSWAVNVPVVSLNTSESRLHTPMRQAGRSVALTGSSPSGLPITRRRR